MKPKKCLIEILTVMGPIEIGTVVVFAFIVSMLIYVKLTSPLPNKFMKEVAEIYKNSIVEREKYLDNNIYPYVLISIKEIASNTKRRESEWVRVEEVRVILEYKDIFVTNDEIYDILSRNGWNVDFETQSFSLL